MGSKISTLIVAVLIFSGIIVGTTDFLISMGNTYGESVPTSLRVLDRSGQIESLIEVNVTKEVTNSSIDTSTDADDDILGSIVSSGFRSIKVIANSIGIFTDLGADVASNEDLSVLGIPTWFIAIITAIAVVLIVLKIVSAILKHEV